MTTKNTSIPTWWEQKAFKEFKSKYIDSGFPLFFIGSGISRWAGLPNWEGLLVELAKNYEIKHPESEVVAKTRKRLAHVSNDPSVYKETGSFLYKQFKDDKEWREALKSILGVDHKKSYIHDVIAQLKWHRIITTNYDSLLESSAREVESKKNVIVAYPGNEKGIERPENHTIFKIHGSITDDNSKIILTKEDYAELYFVPENKKKPNVFERTVGTFLRSATVTLFMGYSHDDPDVKDLYKYSTIDAEEGDVYALVERSGDDFEKRIEENTRDLKIKFISYSGYDYDDDDNNKHNELLEFLEYFAAPKETEKRYQEISRLRKPTIVMLHCGGTISSRPESLVQSPLSVVKKESRYDQGLAASSKELLDSYKKSYNSGNSLDIDISWEILPVDFQMFSENATPELWNVMRKTLESIFFKYFSAPEISQEACISKDPELQQLYDEENRQYQLIYKNKGNLPYKRFLSEFKNRYVLGVVILFGTDTMAYLAPALSFSLQHLPCPIIVTGSNQSPVRRSLLGDNPDFAESDAPDNLKLSMYFLQCFGHRLREIFVCFGKTIHNCVNLRKRSAEVVPTVHTSNKSLELFTYRNVTPIYQYMFKFIDGLFCDNYYTDNYPDFRSPRVRHIRTDALKPSPSQRVDITEFCSVVQHVTVTPSFPLINVAGMLPLYQGQNSLRAFLVEGYPSGTYPTTPNNNFARLLEDLYILGIPVILVSRYGILTEQQAYNTIPLPNSDLKIPVLPLRGIIAESALPLMSMVIGLIRDDDWEDDEKKPYEKLTRRIRLIEQKLAEFFEVRPDIISEEFNYMINKKEDCPLHKGKRSALARWEDELKMNLPRRRLTLPVEQKDSRFVVISRDDFRFLLDSNVVTFEKIGAGPDGLEVLCNVGFDIGIHLFRSFKDDKYSKDLKKVAGNPRFSERTLPDQNIMVEIVNYRLDNVCSLLSNSSIGEISASKLQVVPSETRNQRQSPGVSFIFEITVTRHVDKERNGAKYSVMSYSDQEADFFAKLAYGYEQKDDASSTKFEKDFERLIEDTWSNSTQTMDWLILGIYKSIACGIAKYLRFDALATRPASSKIISGALREAVKVKVLTGDDSEFRVEYSYFDNS